MGGPLADADWREQARWPTQASAARRHQQLEPEHRPAARGKIRVDREAEILSWVVQGKTNPEIGIILGIQLTTVKKHLESTFAKLGVENRTGAVTFALEKISGTA